MANEYRNEMTLEIGGFPYKLRPTFDALANIESKISKLHGKRTSVTNLLNEIFTHGLQASETKIIIQELTLAADDPIPEDDLNNHLMMNKYEIEFWLGNVVLPRIVFGGNYYEKLMDSMSKEELDDSKKKIAD